MLSGLADGKRSKEDLIEAVWGYSYDPLRHDPLIYGLMGRMRHTLEEFSGWIVATDGGYQLDEGVSVTFLSHSVKKPGTSQSVEEWDDTNQDKESSPFTPFEDFDLNLRQLKFLASIKVSDLYTTNEYQKMFPSISRITASRDLNLLVKHKILKRTGKARATSYYRSTDLEL